MINNFKRNNKMMDPGAFSVRGDSKKAVRNAVEVIRVAKSADGSISHDNAQLCIDKLSNILDERIYYGADGVVGMGGLLSAATNTLTAITTTDMSTAASVLKALKDAAAAAGANVLPEIADRKDAHDEANAQNLYKLSVLGAKEGAAEGLTTLLGRAITDVILNDVGTGLKKKVDDYQLSDLVKAVVDSASRPMYTDVAAHYAENFNFRFEFRSRCVTQLEILRSRNARLRKYGIVMGEDIVAMVIIRNLEWAAEQD